MPARHYNLQYNVNGGPWLSGNLDETPGPGKQLAIGGLAVGTYAVKLRMVPLSGDTTPIVSNELIMQVGTPAVVEPVFTVAESVATVAEVIQRRDTLLAAAGVAVTAADAQVMNEALLSTATESGGVITGFVDTATAAATSDATVATVQAMLEQVVAAITAADSSSSAATRVDAASSSADVIPSQTDTYQQAANTSPTFTAQPSQSTATTTSITVTYGTYDAQGDLYSRDVLFNGVSKDSVFNESPGSGKSVTITGLVAGTSYNVQVLLTPQTGNTTTVYSNTVSMVTVTNVPSLSVVAGDAQNVLTMYAAAATSYNIYWTNDGSTPNLTSNKIPGVSSPYTHLSLVNGTTYRYIVTAVNAAGESAATSVSSAVPSGATYPITLTNGQVINTTPVALTAMVASSGVAQQTASDAFQVTSGTASMIANLKTAAIPGTYTREIEITGRGTPDSANLLYFYATDQGPANTDTSTVLAAHRKVVFNAFNTPGSTGVYVYYANTSGTVYFLQANGSWSTSAYSFTAFVGNQRFKIQKTATDYVLTLMNGDGSVIATGTIAISSVRNGSGSDYISMGDGLTDYTCNFSFKVRQ